MRRRSIRFSNSSPGDAHALRAVPIDPTHDRRAGLRYITVAVGRDYFDVPPTSGTFDAPYSGVLTTHRRAAVTRVEYSAPDAAAVLARSGLPDRAAPADRFTLRLPRRPQGD